MSVEGRPTAIQEMTSSPLGSNPKHDVRDVENMVARCGKVSVAEGTTNLSRHIARSDC